MEGYLSLCYYPLIANPNCSTELCVQSNASFTVWYKGDFGLCFEYLVFSAFLGAVFGITSAFYAGIKHTKIQRKRKSRILVVRALISSCILTAFLVDFVGSFWLSVGRPYSVLLSVIVLIIAWSLHLWYIWILSCSVNHHGWGPLNLNAVWILLFVGNILQLRTTIRWKLDSGVYKRSSLPIEEAYFSNFSEVIVYVSFGLQCLYGFTIIWKVSRVTGDDVRMYHADRYRGNTQWSDDADSSVKHHLISSEWRADSVSASYGTITSSGLSPSIDVGNLDASEDGSNPLSLLTFWWVGPLMKRGALGRLQQPEDLLHLPKSLKTSRLRQKFQASNGVCEQNIAGCIQRVDKDDSTQHKALESKENGDDEESDCTKWYDSSTLNIQGSTPPSVTEQINVQKRKDCDSKQSNTSLVRSLNRAFGLHYYPLGVLKLIADMLGFTGPLLLHALVSFMENGTVSYVLIKLTVIHTYNKGTIPWLNFCIS